MVTPPALMAATPVGATTAIFFKTVFAYVFQKGRFARAGLAGQEDGRAGLVDEERGELKDMVTAVE
jgi:hypothetical protein